MEETVLVYLMSLCICFITVSTTEDSHTVTLLGVGMCERLCQQTVGCTRFHYSSRYLLCHLSPGDKEPDASYLPFNITLDKSFGRGKNAACAPLSVILWTKQNKQICCQTSHVAPEPSAERPVGRLLFAGRGPGDVKQLFLHNRTVATYIKDFVGVRKITYIERTHKLLFIEHRSYNLIMSALNGEDKKLVSRMCDAVCVTEDEIFFVSNSRQLHVVSQFGTKKSKVKQIENNAQQMAADMNNRLLYTITNKGKMIVYDYFGQKQREIEGTSNDIYIEPYSRWLYSLKMDTMIYKMELLSTKTPHLPLNDFFGISFCIYKDIVYETTSSSIYILLGKNKDTEIYITDNAKGATCCFLP